MLAFKYSVFLSSNEDHSVHEASNCQPVRLTLPHKLNDRLNYWPCCWHAKESFFGNITKYFGEHSDQPNARTLDAQSASL